jgi:hypothetical protein
MADLSGIGEVSTIEVNHYHWKALSTLIGGTIYMMYVGGLYITGNI